MTLTEAKAAVEQAGYLLDLARHALSVSKEEESRRSTAYKIAVDDRDAAIRAEAAEPPA